MIRKMSQVIWDQDQPHVTAPFDPHSAPFTIQCPHSNPMQPCSNGNQWSERNKAGIKMISMMSRVIWDQDKLHMTAPSRPHSTLIQPRSLFSPVWPCSSHVQPHSPFSPMQESCSEEVTSKCSITRYTKMFSSTSRENCSSPDHLSTADSPVCQ